MCRLEGQKPGGGAQKLMATPWKCATQERKETWLIFSEEGLSFHPWEKVPRVLLPNRKDM